MAPSPVAIYHPATKAAGECSPSALRVLKRAGWREIRNGKVVPEPGDPVETDDDYEAEAAEPHSLADQYEAEAQLALLEDLTPEQLDDLELLNEDDIAELTQLTPAELAELTTDPSQED